MIWKMRDLAAATALVLGATLSVSAQDRRDEQFYYPGGFNWAFLAKYPEGGRLFNAFDYGHAVLYEQLYTRPDAAAGNLEEDQFNYLTRDLLIRPPRFAVAEEVIEPSYAKLAWKAKQMFDWAHILHRQVYDAYADERLTATQRDSLVERLTDYYLSRKDYAFAVVPKSMTLMDEQYYSQVFRKKYPKFNGLIWAYHWLQVGLYEPLILGLTPSERKSGVQAAIARFWSMVKDAPDRFPRMMPMTSAVAPNFSKAHTRAAVIFDNLHMMHDIISDILTSDKVARSKKREVIYQALAEFQDGTKNVMAMDQWWHMGEMMGGVAVMGGEAGKILGDPPTAGTMAPEMRPMDHGKMGAKKPSGGDSTSAHRHDQPASDSVPPTQHDMSTMKMPMDSAAAHPMKRDTMPPKQHDMPSMKMPTDSAAADHPVKHEPMAAADARDTNSATVMAAPGGPSTGPSETATIDLFPIHSWHPVMIHLPLVAFVLAALLDLLDLRRKNTEWHRAATLMWWIAFAGGAAAVTTGLIAYNRVDHSDHAHEAMILHRNVAFAALSVLLVAGIVRWRVPRLRLSVILGVVGALGLGFAGYLGGELVYTHGLGISTRNLDAIMDARGGHQHNEQPTEAAPGAPDSSTAAGQAASALPPPHAHGESGKPHTH
ncbi:MAG: DUF2231 domain-containing protein [Gemmatimonadota bacterium]